MTALIEVDHLKTYFDTRSGTVRAVDDVSWTLEKGESLGLAGESGCGKTTTALSIIRLLPKNGRIVDGHIRYSGRTSRRSRNPSSGGFAGSTSRSSSRER